MANFLDSLFLTLELDTSKFDKSQRDVRESFKKTKDEFVKTGKQIEDSSNNAAESVSRFGREVLGLYAIFAGVSSIKSFVSEIISGDSALGRLSANLNSSSKDIAAFGNLAVEAGGNFEAATGSLQAFNDRINDLQVQGKALPMMFYRLQAAGGTLISTNKGITQTYLDIQRNLYAIEQSQGRSVASYYGRQNNVDPATLNQMLDNTPEEYAAKLAREKRRSAITEDIEAAKQLQNSWAMLSFEAIDLGRKIQTALSPMLQDALKWMNEWIQANQEWLKSSIKENVQQLVAYLGGEGGKELTRFFADLAIIMKDIASALRTTISLFKEMHTHDLGFHLDRALGLDKPAAAPASEPQAKSSGGFFGDNGPMARFGRTVKRQFGYGEPVAPSAQSGSSGESTAASPSEATSGGTASTVQSSGAAATGSVSALDRARFARELETNPGLKEKVMAISAGENQNPAANQAVLESMMNRAAMMGTSLAQEARTTRERGYYAGYNPHALQNPKTRAMIEGNLKSVLGGSNVSNYATDNASGSFSARRIGSGMYTKTFSAGGETFSYPSRSDARGFNRYQAWKNRASSASEFPATDWKTPAPYENPSAASGASEFPATDWKTPAPYENGSRNTTSVEKSSSAYTNWLNTPYLNSAIIDQSPRNFGSNWHKWSGASLAAAGASYANHTSNSSETNIHGPINIHTQATDANGIGNSLRPALERKSNAIASNDGAH